MLRICHLSALCLLLPAASVVFATPESQDRRQLLDAQIVSYMANALNLPPASLSVGSLDERMKIPSCPSGFRISLPYRDHKTALAACDEPKWSAYIPVQITIVSDVLVYAGDLPAGRVLSATDLSVEAKRTRQLQPVEDAALFIGQLLVRPVKQGQAVMRQHVDRPVLIYVLKEAVKAGQAVTLANLRTELKGQSGVPESQRVSSAALNDVVAARRLGQGHRLVASDLRSRQTRLMVSRPVPYGQALSAENINVKSIYDVEVPNALNSLDDIQQMQATRNLSVGHVILKTDIRPAPLIRKSDTVIMSVESGALVITVGLIAEEDGALHEVIQLKNPESGESVQGVVTGAGRVKLQ